MISLGAKTSKASLAQPHDPSIWLLVDHETFTGPRARRAFLIHDANEQPPEGFALYVAKPGAFPSAPLGDCIELPPQLSYLAPGDVLSLRSEGRYARVLWRQNSHQNSVLLTERCDNFCLMCSQPPKRLDDDWLLDEARELVRLLPPTTSDICFTGGEPTIYGDWFIGLMNLCRSLIPNAAVHILSNGRRFADIDFAAAHAAVNNPNMMVGIPIYGAEPSLHDYVVQANGAFDDTVRGILNLAQLQQRIEIRVVIHKQTAPALVEIADFIGRNLPFVEQVALMGLEMTGFARANVNDLWIDPMDYKEVLTEAAVLLDQVGVRTMIYNHQLCLIEPRAWRYTVKSISDWKNEYHPECLKCSVVSDCGGFFHSAKYRMSDHIKAIAPAARGTERLPALLAAPR